MNCVPWLPTIRAIQHNCARSYQWTIAGLEQGVEHRVDVVCLQVRPRECGAIGISPSAYKRLQTIRVSIVIRKGSGLVVDERTNLS